jgi:hypothetical protein
MTTVRYLCYNIETQEDTNRNWDAYITIVDEPGPVWDTIEWEYEGSAIRAACNDIDIFEQNGAWPV